MTDLPAPLTNESHDVRNLDGFMLNVERLMASELMALSSGDEFKAAVALWCRAWKQIPAGSLPDDDRVLASYSGAGRKWKKVKSMALRGFVKCNDGRLYHQTLCTDVLRAFEKKQERRDRTQAATEARRRAAEEREASSRQRDDQRNDIRNDHRNDDRNVHVTTSHRQDRTGQDYKKENNQSEIKTQPKPDTGPAGEPPKARAEPLHERYREVQARVEAIADNPKLLVFGRIDRWLKDGADPEADIYPTIERLKGRWRGGNLEFFDGAIADSIAARKKPLQAGAASSAERSAQHRTIAGPDDFTWELRLAAFRTKGTWNPLWGAKPDEPGCLAPKHLLAGKTDAA